MSNLFLNEPSDLQDEPHAGSNCHRQSIEGDFSKRLLCLKPGCEHLHFKSEVEHRNHLLGHITLPTVVVPRLDHSTLQKPFNNPTAKQESLKVRLKLTSQAGSDKRAFKVVKQSQKVLSGPGGLFCSFKEETVTELPEKTFTTQQDRSSGRRPVSEVELDVLTDPTDFEEQGGSVSNSEEQPEQNRYRDGEERENDLEEEEDEEEEEDYDEGGREDYEEGGREEDTEDSASQEPSTAPPSPSPSEILRPRGLLAPEQLVDDDSCYPRSPPISPTRMVEMNGSTSAVSGSDNDSGLSRSPGAFTGGSGAGGEEESSINWDELVNQASSAHSNNDSDTSHENGQTGGSSNGNINNVVSEIGASSVASNILENDPLLLPESSSSAEGEQDNLNLLQNLTSDALPTEVDRGAGSETEYMSLDRLGDAGFCCEVCGERSQDQRVLEEHRALAGHYKCQIMPECGSIVWATSAELAAHQSSIHGVNASQSHQSQSSPHTPSPRTSPRTPGTPPVQQLAQQVQRLPIPPQAGYPPIPGVQYPVPPQMVPMMPQMMPGQMPGQMPQRRPPMGYRMPMPSQAGFGPGSPNQQQPGFSGSIQPRPLNTLVAQQPPRGPAPGRLPPGVMPPRGMVPSTRGQKRSGPVPGVMPPGAKQRRVEGMMPPQSDNGPGKKSDANAVANILATRGITVTPAGGAAGPRGAPAQPPPQARQRQNMLAPAPPPPVTTLNLNSSISIIPTTGAAGNGRQQNNAGFAIPQARSAGRQQVATTNVDRPPRPPTVDLTGDGPQAGSTRLQMGPTNYRGRGRPSTLTRTTCQICDKVFASHDMLNQHMFTVHRQAAPGKLPFRCNLCNAQYPTNQGLQQHRQTYHKETMGMNTALAPGEEMVIPLIDLKQPGVAQRLGQLGIHHCIPLSGLGNQSNGYFSLPVVSIDGSRPGAAGNLRSLGASGVLSIGPIKLVPK
ncbi:uncharacterized protein LOC113205758 isoform X3 [Frankliniella occidentalis]|uniref:Uncharacterized protein LOC113205758 isoform X3 n=1 Tax=Frankliniella occidentalis TaxID=133901 RepID=A0A6J1S7Z3_FRAOC|nr:uncharacterized protein LOC113205758 isoform X3 [Frankliniella occidentalis]